MVEVIANLSRSLSKELKSANEIWVSIALLNNDGIDFILKYLPNGCLQHYLIGIDLPTEPKALEKLNRLQLKSKMNVRIYSGIEYFHPKVYMVRKGSQFSAFVGSANCTIGGLSKNIELSTFITDQYVCEKLLDWHNLLFEKGKPLTSTFIEKYKCCYAMRIKNKKREEKEAKKEKSILNDEYNTTLIEKNDFIEALKRYRKGKKYLKIVQERSETIELLRKTLDYPKFQKLDIEKYFSIWDLGHLISIAKPAIERNISKLPKVLKYLCNEKIDIATRYERVLNGDLRIKGISNAFISKVLVAHSPDLYYVKNRKSEKALQKYGIKLPRGFSDGDKYKITCTLLRKVCEDTGIKDFAVLDYYLYIEGNEE